MADAQQLAGVSRRKALLTGAGLVAAGATGGLLASQLAEGGALGASADDFLAQVCVAWEREARMAESGSTRVVIVRTGLPLDRNGGVLGKMLLPFKLGLGATLGSGDQFMPWIHIDDWTAIVSWLIRHDRAAGVFNASAPAPVTNRAFTRALGRAVHRPAVLLAPPFVLRAALGEMASMIVHGQRVLPAAAEQLGFSFSHPTLEPALDSLNL